MSGITQSIITEIVENTRISIKNIYFRFEDKVYNKKEGK